MRRALLVVVLAIAWPGSAATLPGPALALKAPKATTYLHKIDFVGRMSPASPDARVHLFRGTTLVSTVRVRGDGTFFIPVHLANPGPFHVAWLQARSNEVTVRIRPRLQAELVGSRVAGAPLRLVASLEPAAAGLVRVQVIRGGRVAWQDVTTSLGPVLWPKSVTRSFWKPRQVTRFLARTFPQGAPAAPPFDFAHRRLILVAAGPRSSTGYGLEILRVTERRGDIRVLARETTPSLGQRVEPRLTSPYRLIAIPATGKRVYVSWAGRP